MILVVESPSGMRHAYTMTYGVGRTLCGRSVPRAHGWFGPIDREADCARCLTKLAKLEPPRDLMAALRRSLDRPSEGGSTP